MKNILPISIVTFSGLLLLAWITDSATRSVYLVGDSTMSEKDVRAYPETGWGSPFSNYFETDIIIKNHAQNGQSTRTFLEEGRWKPLIDNLNEGDYVFIQFGHNDEMQTKPQSTTKEEYRTNLVKYVRETLARNAQPVLLTPIARRHFDQNGKLIDTHEVYSELMRDVARSENVLLIDMDRKSQRLLKNLGPEKSRFLFNHLEPGQNPNYPNGLEDDTHFNELGARRMAELVLEGIREVNLDLRQKIVQR